MTDCAAYGRHQSLPATADNEQGYVMFNLNSCNMIWSILQQRGSNVIQCPKLK